MFFEEERVIIDKKKGFSRQCTISRIGSSVFISMKKNDEKPETDNYILARKKRESKYSSPAKGGD